MAHSVHESSAAAYCSRWAIEHALAEAIIQIFKSASHEEVLRQREVASLWRSRCDAQIQMVGVCVLRGVYDIVPADYTPDATHCPFEISASPACPGSFYVTPHCLVKCEEYFYDPCKCDNSMECEDFVFVDGATCETGRLTDVTMFASDHHVQLHSMTWPSTILNNEADTQTTQVEMDALLKQMRDMHAADYSLRSLANQELYETIVTHLTSRTITEGQTPDAYCDDLLDYWDPAAQHPVGYHPTTACSADATNFRGFASWMSVNAETNMWQIDPVRMRNRTETSTQFGAAHLVCDASIYGTLAKTSHGLLLETLWNSEAKADISVPTKFTDSGSMLHVGAASSSIFDTPWVQSEQQMTTRRHSTGLLPWRLQTQKVHQGDLDALWPYEHLANPEKTLYGFDGDEAISDCALPQLRTCVSDNECSPLVCLKNTFYSADNQESSGICAESNTCFQHAHCPANRMCSGEGRCVLPSLTIKNEFEDEIDAQLFCSDKSVCKHDTWGLSHFQRIPDFAHRHGMCKHSNWLRYNEALSQSFTSNTDASSSLVKLFHGDKVWHDPTKNIYQERSA